jgi:hypothetical protein
MVVYCDVLPLSFIAVTVAPAIGSPASVVTTPVTVDFVWEKLDDEIPKRSKSTIHIKLWRLISIFIV